ncbi:MAG: HDOD domain-containing protein [Burkholderiales bacterium]|nr:HDOD domain-containing protein [Burkholderiales bacterium]MBH2017373.1 HDOD domain-containing protein [Burkholderiales bacterium]
MIHQPLPSLEAWVNAFEKADIPILPESVAELALLRQIEDARGDMDAHTLAENLSADPLMTLKVLVHVSRYCTRLSVEPPETLVGAIVMQGVGPFFTAFEHPISVSELLADQPEALDGLQSVIRRSRRAAHFAMGFALKRQDQDAVVIQEAALLHGFAEMLLWCLAPELALTISRRLADDHTLRSSLVQREVLGIQLQDLAQVLMRRWQLPDLLIHCTDERLANDPKVRSVALGVRIARHTQHGWDDPHCLAALPDDVADVGQLLNISPDAASRLLRGMDD